jgi:hypothetical protein
MLATVHFYTVFKDVLFWIRSGPRSRRASRHSSSRPRAASRTSTSLPTSERTAAVSRRWCRSRRCATLMKKSSAMGEGVRTSGTARDAPQLARSLPCLSASRESLRRPQTFNPRRTSPYGPSSRIGSGFSQAGPSPQDKTRNTHHPRVAGKIARSVCHRARI